MARLYKKCRQIAEDLSKAGWVRLRGVSRMDAATEPPWMGLRRPPQPDPPRHPTGNPLLLRLVLLLLLLLRLAAGAGLQALPTNTLLTNG